MKKHFPCSAEPITLGPHRVNLFRKFFGKPYGRKPDYAALLMARPKVEENPAKQSDALKIYISSRMRAGNLDLHSAFVLEYEAIRIGRVAYRQRAWRHHLYLHGFFAMFMLG